MGARHGHANPPTAPSTFFFSLWQCAPSPSHQFFFCGKISSHLQQQWFKATYLMAKDLLVLHRLLGFYFYQLQLELARMS
ncbi:hypothetical protein DAI22_10g053700 [Oryza sativa Japonica Group]|nr:hypothetical protein DAI22_10g053700 [Oryza sativa Japonica Group]